ncbi:unnamed protein product [Adineta ricciae]|uniref:G-protein coupled receptors family 1 profile domain-containing protein n=1 Tax=Adineta ricciae TaxID=249248 RepID=A0A815SSB8_ADIRI|nr:unnamed protein product [Adineta ricciae]CAF1495691.1 unnamed protein product [Adineta ricciae]
MSTSLAMISVQIARFTLPVIISFGIAGNLLNIIVLTRRRLYNNACSRYFLAAAVNNLLVVCLVLVYRFLMNVYQVDLGTYSEISCRIINYIITLTSYISPYLIISASIDRYCASSINARIRKFSSVRVSQWVIFIILIAYAVFFINIFFLYDLHSSKGFTCALQADTVYSRIYVILQVFLYALAPPFLMILFGVRTIHNIKRSRLLSVVISRFNRTEQQLARMLIFQVCVHVSLTIPASVFYLLSALPNVISPTSTYVFLSTIALLLYYCSYSSSFFLYFLSGSIYRQELLELFHKIFPNRVGNRIVPVANVTLHPLRTVVFNQRSAV